MSGLMNMLKNTLFAFMCVVFFSGVFFSGASYGFAESSSEVQSEDNPWEVRNLKIDQTAENAVVARTKAMAEAKRQAFQKLVERNLPAEEVKGFKIPDDKIINSVVQDFEIEDEQISANQYVANFTVRFKRRVLELIQVNIGMKGVLAPPPSTIAAAGLSPAPSPSVTVTKPAVSAVATEALSPPPVTPTPKQEMTTSLPVAGGVPSTAQSKPDDKKPPVLKPKAPIVSRGVLVLPYLQNISGKLRLWEDPNPWMQAWQTSPLTTPWGRNIILPVGDINDISSGSSDAIWSGDTRVVEKLRAKYNVQEVILAVINKSGPSVTIDVYHYGDGILSPKQTLTPYVANMDGDAPYRQSVQEVLKHMQSSPEEQAKKDDIVASIAAQVVETTPDVIPLASPVDEKSVPDANERAQLTLAPPREKPMVKTTDAASSATAVPPASVVQAPVAPQRALAPPSPVLPSTETGAVNVEAGLSGISSWLNIQKRLAEISPVPDVKVKSLTSSKASFSVRFPGSFDDLKTSLALKGMILSGPLPGGGASAAVYDLRLTE